MVRAFCKPTSLSAEPAFAGGRAGGFAVSVRGEGGVKDSRVVIDSPVVRFDSDPPDMRGYHTAVVVGPNRGAFPPNTLFALKEVIEGGFTYDVPGGPEGGIRVRQNLLIVSATWADPAVRGSEGQAEASKLCGHVHLLTYGRREDFAKGLDAIFLPGLAMAHEFDREQSWIGARVERWRTRGPPMAREVACGVQAGGV